MSGSPATLPAPKFPPGRRAALIVATTNYTDPALRGLRAPATDAADLALVLADPEIGGFDVTSVLDPTVHDLRVAIHKFLTACGPEDLVVLYLSCHGLPAINQRTPGVLDFMRPSSLTTAADSLVSFTHRPEFAATSATDWAASEPATITWLSHPRSRLAEMSHRPRRRRYCSTA